LINSAARGLTAIVLLGLSACSTQLVNNASASTARVELSDTPYFPQSDYQCGPAALATILGAAGESVTADALVHEVYISGRKGSLQAELLTAARRHGRIAYVLEPSLSALLGELEQGRPVLVLQNFGASFLPHWHYAVVIGYDRERDTFLLRSGREPRQELAARRFLGTWSRADQWSFIALPPGALPADANAARYLDAVSALEALGNHGAVTPAYEAALGRWPDEALAWFALANNRLALGQTAAAESSYREVLRIAPEQIPARNNLALLLARRGCIDEARAVLEPASAAAAGPLAAEIADSERQINQQAAAHPTCTAP
jgi:hypothetical protein